MPSSLLPYWQYITFSYVALTIFSQWVVGGDITRHKLTLQMPVMYTNGRSILIIAIPADVLAPSGTWPSANGVMDMKSYMFSSKISWQSWFLFTKYRLPDYDITPTIYFEKHCVFVRKNIIPFIYLLIICMIKVQFRGPKLYRKEGALYQEDFYLLRVFRSSSLNLHDFHLINIVFWWQIFFRKHDKSTSNDQQDHHVLVVDVVIMTSQYLCTRALSQSHVAKAWKPRAGSTVDRFWDWL